MRKNVHPVCRAGIRTHTEHESPPITTRQGLPPNLLCLCLYDCTCMSFSVCSFVFLYECLFRLSVKCVWLFDTGPTWFLTKFIVGTAVISGQSYKASTIVNYDSRVVIWGIFQSGTTLGS